MCPLVVVTGDFLINLADGTAAAVQAVRFAFTLSVIFTYPIGFHPCRQSINDMFCQKTPLATHWGRHLVVTVGLYVHGCWLVLAPSC